MTIKPNHQHRQLAKNAAGLRNSKCAGFYGSRAIDSLPDVGGAPPAKLIRFYRDANNSASPKQRCYFLLRTRHSQLLIANLNSSSCELDKTLRLARLPIFKMRGDLLQMTLTDDSQSVTLRALELKRLGMHICQLFVGRVSCQLPFFSCLRASAFRDAQAPLLALERLPLPPQQPKKDFPLRFLIPKSVPS